MSCQTCGASVPAAARFCPACGTATHSGTVLTMTSSEAAMIRSAAPRTPAGSTADSGWLSSSDSIDHGRFAPGIILDNRYRVLGLLGRGGMGEVYRADDLRLGQQVALKFLPGSLARDPGRLAQFHNEVRTARQVSHANVCRVYDVGEIDGQLFITMEYVDGEDLSGLLRRIGRLPEDKGIEIARQICAGLAAAHERGILHRDLKPANIMLDGSGKVRIMDFGLAAVGEVTDIRAGTPAYMAPEQLAGQEVTVRSDIYALGLVLYELFTGRRAYEARTLAELIEHHRSGTLTAPGAVVKSLDPAIESAIVRCLDAVPVRRPSSAIAVSAALPGGDPLAAALAAGETPSPEMVAAAGGEDAMFTLPGGIAWLTVAVVAVIAAAGLTAKTSLLSKVPLGRPGAVLADRSEEIRAAFGYADPAADQASGFYYDGDYFEWARSKGRSRSGWPELASGHPPVVRFWYRTSPVTLIPVNALGTVSPTDPPLLLHGMVKMTVDTKGRLLRFEAAPPQIERAGETPAAFDWYKAFSAAGLDRSALTEVPPSRTPATYADERKAWTGTLPETDIPIAIEAAAYRGRPVLFDIVLPWVKPSREPEPPSGNSQWIVISLLLAGAAIAAWANLRRGRADRRGAFRLAAFMTLLVTAAWVVSPHVPAGFEEQQRFFARVGIALLIAGAMYLVYLGLEPFVRRLWPSMLVGWSRVLGGRIRDPMVGRDVMIGVACGGTLALLGVIRELAPLLGQAPAPPRLPDLGALMGARGTVATLLGSVNNGFQNALLTVFEFAFLRAAFEWITRRPFGAERWTIAGKLRMSPRASEKVFIALVVVMMTALEVRGVPRADVPLTAAYEAASTLLILVVLLRVGILGSVVMLSVSSVLLRVPMTFDSSSLYAGSAWFALALLLALAIAGFRLSTRDHRGARTFA